MKHETTVLKKNNNFIIREWLTMLGFAIALFFWPIPAAAIDINDPPVITSDGAEGFEENSFEIVIDVQSTDDNDVEGGGLTYSFTDDFINSSDASLFEILPNTGHILFLDTPDFENPADSDSDNIYNIEVRVCDSDNLCATQAISIVIIDMGEYTSLDCEESNYDVFAIEKSDDAEGTSALYAVNIYTNKYEKIFDLDIPVRNLCLDEENSRLYAIGDTGVYAGMLYTWLIGNSGGFTFLADLNNLYPDFAEKEGYAAATFYDGHLYFFKDDEYNRSKLFSVFFNSQGLPTGLIEVANIPELILPQSGVASSFADIAFREDGVLYGIDYHFNSNNEVTSNVRTQRFWKFDLSSGIFNMIRESSSFWNSDFVSSYAQSEDLDFYGMAFSVDGALFGLDLAGQLSSINVNNGNITTYPTYTAGANAVDGDWTRFNCNLVVIAGSAPIAENDTATTFENTPVIVDVQNNDSDINGDALTTTVISASSGGITTILNGDSIEYNPPLGFIGNDFITYQICDNSIDLLCDTAIVNITVLVAPCTNDTDGDGICDDIDNCVNTSNTDQADCDNDGVGDVCESDDDSDGVPNDCDICQGADSSGDTDGDGICDDIDNCVNTSNTDQADCDNDGVGDVCESDDDSDGVPNDCDICQGADSSGDTDGDGICDDIDNCVNTSNTDQADCDNDGVGDVCESDDDSDGVPNDCDICQGADSSGDTDGDGICDDIDNCVNTSNTDQADCDNDGIGDVCESDDDSDGVPNDCDICQGADSSGDTDSDGICDDVDNCVNTSNTDQADCNNDGVGDVCESDDDSDGVPNDCDICQGVDSSGDTDGDGICDDIDNCINEMNTDQLDCDNDGQGDVCESDDDSDGVPNDCDVCQGSDSSGDTDSDGICDDLDNCINEVNADQLDCDNDGEGDACEPDDDNDGIPNDCDICLGDNATGDADGDGICDDIDNCIDTANPDQADCNNDGVADVCEPDSDNDGIPDDCDNCVGAAFDSDNDGICDDVDNCPLTPNTDQADCDSDGVGDVCESDDDNDGVPNDCDVCQGADSSGDTDGDGICDDVDNCVNISNTDQADCDNDGEGDICELDDDNDSVPNDCDICQGADSSGDTDGDGICDDIDNCVDIANTDQLDCDGDGIADVCENDDDNDGIPNDCDSCVGDNSSGDTDGDGICDDIDNCVDIANTDQLDCDGDGIADVCENDDDNDGIPNDCDSCVGDNSSGDTDGDGICDDIDNCVDVANTDQLDCDGDGIADVCEDDSDNDGVPDDCDNCIGASADSDNDGICDDVDNCVNISNNDQADCDNDGVGDACESDDDSDGVPNDCDICQGADSTGDTDGDGICDDVDNCVSISNNDQADCDADGVGDVCESDDDNDGVPNDCDVCQGADSSGDTDGDGICDDVDNCVNISNTDQADCDNDGEGDICELDDDNDGVPNDCDICQGADSSGDTDGDGICDDIDNCVDIANTDQSDCDGDGIADACEDDSDNDGVPDDCDNCVGASVDSDNDGICDDVDNCPLTPNTDQADCDSDGVGDVCESDDDNDGVPNDCDVCQGADSSGDTDGDGICDDVDNCVNISNTDQADCDNDGEGDICELDDDNDGVPNDCDLCQGADSSGDTDGDGICDDVDNCVSISNTDQADCDNDGEGDVCESDTDGDGIPDDCDTIVGCNNYTASISSIGGGCVAIGEFVQLLATIETGDTNPAIYSFSWTGPNGFISSAQNPIINNVTEVDAGTYSVTITNLEDACITELSTTVEVSIEPDLQEVLTSSEVICIGGNLVIYVPPFPSIDVNYEWTGPLGSTSSGAYPNESEIYIDNYTAANDGIYQLIITVNGCPSTISEPLAVFAAEIVNAPAVADSIELCEGEPLILETTTFSEEYIWTAPNGIIINEQEALVTTSATINDSGVYTLVVGDNGCFSPISEIYVIVSELPSATSLEVVPELCLGDDIVLVAEYIPGVTYQWISPSATTDSYFGDLNNADNVIWTIEPTTTISITENPIWYEAGNWRVQVVNDAGCVSIPSVPVLVTINNPPETAFATDGGDVCEGLPVQLYASEVTGASYRWYDGDPTGAPAGTLIATEKDPIIYNLPVGLHQFFVETEIGSCTSLNAGQTTVLVKAKPVVDSVYNTGPYCLGETIELHAPSVAGANYNWNGPNGFETGLQNPIIENAQAENNGIYTLYVEVDGCTSITVYTNVSINSIPTTPTINSNGPVCVGDDLLLFGPGLPGGNGYYEWSGPNGFNSTEQNPVIPMATTDYSGPYTLTVGVLGCNEIAFNMELIHVVDVPNEPEINSNSNIGNPLCIGMDVQLSSPDILGATYTWEGPNGFTSDIANPLIPDAMMLDTGTYYLFVSAGSCISEMATTEVVLNEPVGVPIALGDGLICEGGDVVFSIANPIVGASYEWFSYLPNISIGVGEELLLEELTAEQSGAYYVIATVGACASDPSMTTPTGGDAVVQIDVVPSSNNIAWLGDPVYACEDTITVRALPFSVGEGKWSWLNPSTTAAIHSPDEVQTFISGLLPGENKLIWSLYNGVCGFTSSDTLLIEWGQEPEVYNEKYEIAYNELLENIDLLENDFPNSSAYEISIITEPENGTLLALENGLFSYWPNKYFAGVDQVEYSLCHKFCPDKCAEGVATFEIALDVECVAPTVITPNGDGLNDQFIIPCVRNYPGSSLSVFNRWGSEIYFSDDYQNTWEGTFKQDGLPSGTYYYVIHLNDGEGTIMKGYVFIER